MKYIKFLPVALFTVFSLKLMIMGGNWCDVAITAILGATSYLYQCKFLDEEYEKLKTRGDEIDKHLSVLYKKDEELQGKLSTLNLAGLRHGNAIRS